MGHVVGGTFEGSMTKNFEDGKTLYEIADTPVIARNRIFLNKSVKCRYIRYKADNDKCAELAEMDILCQWKGCFSDSGLGESYGKRKYACAGKARGGW